MSRSEEGVEAIMEEADDMMQGMVDVSVPFLDDSSDDDDSSCKEVPLSNHDIRETAILDGFRHAVDSHAKEFITDNGAVKQIADHQSHNKLVTTHNDPNHTITDDSSSRDRQAAVSSNETAYENVPNSVPISNNDWKPDKLQLPTWAQLR
mmetsp:Transcript_19058/g.34564  ORF Transcript_19058/g.34564 Transcript_19058/m.34564 type:complete len:150 (-) Transcript_19058:951-1400(-)